VLFLIFQRETMLTSSFVSPFPLRLCPQFEQLRYSAAQKVHADKNIYDSKCERYAHMFMHVCTYVYMGS
jgi:hypothetical protein